MRESRPRRRRVARAFAKVSFRRSAQQRATEPISVYCLPGLYQALKVQEMWMRKPTLVTRPLFCYNVPRALCGNAQGCMADLDAGSEL